MKAGAAALALSLLAVPGYAQAPSTVEAYDAAVAARLAGDPARAVELLRGVVASQPDNADAQLQFGLALLGLGRLDEAETAFRRTLQIAPNYADASIGLARVEQRRGNRESALAHLRTVDPANAEASDLRTRLQSGGVVEAGYKWRLDVDGSHTSLTQGQPSWREGSWRVTHQASPATAVSAAVEVSHRFARTDIYGELRLERRFPNNEGSAYLVAGATPNADFRPEWQIGVGGEFRIRPGPAATLFTIEARQARYRVGDIQTLNPGIDQYLLKGRAWVSARWINIFDENGRRRSGWLGRGDLLATERLRLFAGAADAPDTSEGRVVDTFSLFGGLSYDATERMTIRASLAHDDREIGSDRLQFAVGAGFKF